MPKTTTQFECQCELLDPSIVITNLIKRYCLDPAIVIKIKIACCFYICQLFLYMPTILYMPTVSIYAHCFYISPMCLYAHCVQICSLCFDMPTIFRYAHCVQICSLSLHMLTVEIYAYCLYICSLSLHTLLKKEIQTQIPYICLNKSLHSCLYLLFRSCCLFLCTNC